VTSNEGGPISERLSERPRGLSRHRVSFLPALSQAGRTQGRYRLNRALGRRIIRTGRKVGRGQLLLCRLSLIAVKEFSLAQNRES
jgi:hypothetical protein